MSIAYTLLVLCLQAVFQTVLILASRPYAHVLDPACSSRSLNWALIGLVRFDLNPAVDVTFSIVSQQSIDIGILAVCKINRGPELLLVAVGVMNHIFSRDARYLEKDDEPEELDLDLYTALSQFTQRSALSRSQEQLVGSPSNSPANETPNMQNLSKAKESLENGVSFNEKGENENHSIQTQTALPGRVGVDGDQEGEYSSANDKAASNTNLETDQWDGSDVVTAAVESPTHAVDNIHTYVDSNTALNSDMHTDDSTHTPPDSHTELDTHMHGKVNTTSNVNVHGDSWVEGVAEDRASRSGSVHSVGSTHSTTSLHSPDGEIAIDRSQSINSTHSINRPQNSAGFVHSTDSLVSVSPVGSPSRASLSDEESYYGTPSNYTQTVPTYDKRTYDSYTPDYSYTPEAGYASDESTELFFESPDDNYYDDADYTAGSDNTLAHTRDGDSGDSLQTHTHTHTHAHTHPLQHTHGEKQVTPWSTRVHVFMLRMGEAFTRGFTPAVVLTAGATNPSLLNAPYFLCVAVMPVLLCLRRLHLLTHAKIVRRVGLYYALLHLVTLSVFQLVGTEYAYSAVQTRLLNALGLLDLVGVYGKAVPCPPLYLVWMISRPDHMVMVISLVLVCLFVTNSDTAQLRSPASDFAYDCDYDYAAMHTPTHTADEAYTSMYTNNNTHNTHTTHNTPHTREAYTAQSDYRYTNGNDEETGLVAHGSSDGLATHGPHADTHTHTHTHTEGERDAQQAYTPHPAHDHPTPAHAPTHIHAPTPTQQRVSKSLAMELLERYNHIACFVMCMGWGLAFSSLLTLPIFLYGLGGWVSPVHYMRKPLRWLVVYCFGLCVLSYLYDTTGVYAVHCGF
ncbi:hypothetical protein SARC_07453, partial [Sphaeroforma arctica JP610]